MTVRLRAAGPDDAESVAQVWHRAWGDGHQGNVPDELYRHRTFDDFLQRARARIPVTTVADDDGTVVGFVTVQADELEQVFVLTEARGTGVARDLLRAGEAAIASAHEVAWLAVVAGNTRARRFYEREGWYDAGAFDYAAGVDGGSVVVPCHRYEKRVDRPRV